MSAEIDDRVATLAASLEHLAARERGHALCELIGGLAAHLKITVGAQAAAAAIYALADQVATAPSLGEARSNG